MKTIFSNFQNKAIGFDIKATQSCLSFTFFLRELFYKKKSLYFLKKYETLKKMMRLIQKIISVGKPSSKNILVENFVVEKFVFLRKKNGVKKFFGFTNLWSKEFFSLLGD